MMKQSDRLHHYTRNILTPSIQNALRAIEKADDPVVVEVLLIKIIVRCGKAREVLNTMKPKINDQGMVVEEKEEESL